MKRGLSLILIALLLIGVLVLTGCAQSDSGSQGNANEETKITKITIGKVPYPDMWPATHIMENIAQELGYETEIVEADIGLMFQDLAQGNISVFPDVCLPVVHQPYIDKYEGKFELVGEVYADAPSGLTVPSYVDIDSIEELKGRADEFGGRIVGIEPSSGIMLQAEAAMEAYGLDEYELLESSTPAMLAEVKKATNSKEPILFLSWRPHPMWVNYDLKMLEDTENIWPPYTCHTGVNNNLKEDAPDLYAFIEKFNIPMNDIEVMLEKMESENADIEVLAEEWIEENRSEVDTMLGK